MKKVLFVIDKVELKYFEFNKLVTNFWLIKELLERKNEVYITTIPNLLLRGDVAYTKCYESFLYENNIFYKDVKIEKEINDSYILDIYMLEGSSCHIADWTLYDQNHQII